MSARSWDHETCCLHYLYCCLNRVPLSRRLERESQRNVKLMWLTGRLMPDFKASPMADSATAMNWREKTAVFSEGG